MVRHASTRRFRDCVGQAKRRSQVRASAPSASVEPCSSMKASGAFTNDTEDRSAGASAGARGGEAENGSNPTNPRAIQLALERRLQFPPPGDETSSKAQET